MTGTGITLRQLLLDEDGKHSFTKGITAPLSNATKGMAVTPQMLRLNAQLGLIAKAGAQAFAASNIKGIDVGLKGLNVGITAALAGMPKMQLPSMAFVQVLANNPAFQVQQRQIVAGIIAANVMPKVGFGATLVQAAQMVQAAAEPAASASETRTYGSHQLSPEATVLWALTLWPIVQTHLATSTDKHLLDSYLLTLCLVVLIWCALAAAP